MVLPTELDSRALKVEPTHNPNRPWRCCPPGGAALTSRPLILLTGVVLGASTTNSTLFDLYLRDTANYSRKLSARLVASTGNRHLLLELLEEDLGDIRPYAGTKVKTPDKECNMILGPASTTHTKLAIP